MTVASIESALTVKALTLSLVLTVASVEPALTVEALALIRAVVQSLGISWPVRHVSVRVYIAV